jgi:hypothetical protein
VYRSRIWGTDTATKILCKVEDGHRAVPRRALSDDREQGTGGGSDENDEDLMMKDEAKWEASVRQSVGDGTRGNERRTAPIRSPTSDSS